MFKLLLTGILSITCVASTLAQEPPTGELAAYAQQLQSMTHEQLMKAMMENMEGMTTVFGSIKDAQSAKLAKPKLELIGQKMEILQKAGETLDSSLSEAQVEAMEEKYAPQIQTVMGKMMTAMMGLAANPDVVAELGDLGAMMRGGAATP